MSENSTTHLEIIKPEQTPENSPEMPDPPCWHKTLRLPDGAPIGRLGAYWYILNEDGSLISDGYHEISLNENGGYRGTRSTRTELVVLSTMPE